MSRVINCDDGVVIRGDTDAELLANATAHLREAHPDLVGEVSAQDLLAQAVEV